MVLKKNRTAYFCSQCGAEHPRWQGQCRECAQWNSLVEEKKMSVRGGGVANNPMVDKQALPDISLESSRGHKSGIDEFDRVLGGQLVPGAAVLIGGEPGIGKSTLLLQAAGAYSALGLKVAYITGEEAPTQIKQRAQRLGVTGENISVINATCLEDITRIVSETPFAVVLIDSIQTVASSNLDSPPGTVGQVREAAHQLILQARTKQFALFLVGHVTKDGMVAGPKLLEHMVDTVIYFEGDSSHLYRILRATKNRFGSVSEIGLFEMLPEGLVEVVNPSSLFMSDRNDAPRTGSVVTSICQGQRPILVEIQALVSPSSYGNPQRVAGGIDNKRLALLLAILERRGGYPMGANDVFVSVAGGLRLSEPAVDLPVLIAIASSVLNRPVDPHTLVVGEVGLSGEVRGITMIDQRINEAGKMGLKTVVAPVSSLGRVKATDVNVVGVKTLSATLENLLG
ncbi:MAG: DNA repair protein RadA [candidate division Zixibacteria bacterium]|nr:DNA repair protein RadA [candidate division Zixibacteria bacterium]